MAIGSINYPQPVMVNGFSCKNCTEVDEAKSFIDPQHPSAGPFGVDAKADPTLAGKHHSKNSAVTFGGALSNTNNATSSSNDPSSLRGSQLDLSA